MVFQGRNQQVSLGLSGVKVWKVVAAIADSKGKSEANEASEANYQKDSRVGPSILLELLNHDVFAVFRWGTSVHI